MTHVVNIIPNIFSGETNQDSEPNLAIDPADPRRIAASAFTPDPLGGANAPVFVSVDGGLTWSLNNIVPSTAGNATGDITLGFGHGGRLYAGILRRPGGLRLNILRTTNFTSPTVMDVLVDRTGSGVDQPYVEAARVFRGSAAGRDRVYVGNNDFNAASGRTATVDVSLDGAAATPPSPANFNARRIEPRATNGQDLPPIRPAVHIDGTIYAAYFGWRTGALTDVVVARDDNWAAGATQFTNLTDSGDGLAGQRVVTGVNVPFENFQTMGMERLVASDLSVGVDPRDSSRVWVAWGDRPGGTTNLTLHVRRSTDRGQTWSADLRTIPNAKAPAICVNSRGRVGFLYQQLTGAVPNQRWVTRIERTGDDFATFGADVLATVPANAPAPTFLPYLGDYVDLKSPGKDFCGIFSANNTPNNANFPTGIQYQRNANFATQTLFAADGITPVNVSIDPFFFLLTELAPDADVYVADWTDSAASFDRGVEPSSEPVFYNRSDVWTRISNAPGAFDANNRPVNEPPVNGPGVAGRNFAFARIRRRGTGSAVVATTHFLVSPFGTGSNYEDAGTMPDITVTMGAAVAEVTMASGYRWQLGPTSSTHVCLAVEVTTPQDPIVAPSLLGRAPGWPTTDLLVINDNNKAQRNMAVGPAGKGGFMTMHALIHNAALVRRDIVLNWERTRGEGRRDDRVGIIGGRSQILRPSGTIVVRDLLPGEHRWLRLTLHPGEDEPETEVAFAEMVGNVAVNGFAVAVRAAPTEEVSAYLLDRMISVYTRLEAFGFRRTEESVERARKVRERKVTDDTYLAFAAGVAESHDELVRELGSRVGRRDQFGLAAAHRLMRGALDSRAVDQVQSHHGALLEAIDSALTSLDTLSGVPADICQNLRWQVELFRLEKLNQLPSVDRLLRESLAFVSQFETRDVTVKDYPRAMQSVLDGLREAADALDDRTLMSRFESVAADLDDPKSLQRSHWEYLARLSTLVS
ncbi:MAG TPA: hypothetical protein VFO73_02740 [Candidatus Limnocylindrales bacterium]|nr:hypothetical protein [Candidatus Limnocylindrales bacterium]